MPQSGEERLSMTFDEVSMERSKNFRKALDELKNLRPQLYSAAEYCEKSYVHNEQKQMVLDNLKDYTVKALVNAVDHLGTVANKLTDLFEQQKSHISTVDLKITCLDQRLQTCQNYTDEEGLRQQQFSVLIPRYHKHYVLPGPVSKKMQISSKTIETDAAGPKYTLERALTYVSGIAPSKTLGWHLATETKSGLIDVTKAPSRAQTSSLASSEDTVVSTATTEAFCLSDAEAAVSSVPTIPRLLPSINGAVHSNSKSTPVASMQQDNHQLVRPLSANKSFVHPRIRSARPPVRSKSVLSALFSKKTTKSNAG